MNVQERQLEDEVTRNPYSLKSWLNFLQFKKDEKPTARFLLYERALEFLPRSYKLWFAYLSERIKSVELKSISDPRYDILVKTFERSLVHMHKMPRIWREYCSILMKMKKGTTTRHTFDRALKSLPITQHKDLWKLYIAWVKDFGIEETAVRVYRRYLMYEPSGREGFVSYLESIGQFEEAARQLAICVDDDHYISPEGTPRHLLWMRMCDLCSKHPDAVANTIKVDAILRSGIARFSDEVGRLWCKLGDFYIRQGQFEKSRDIFEEAMTSVTTVRDFTTVFNAYAKVEESVVTAKMKLIEAPEDEDEDTTEDVEDVEMGLARIEYLMDKRPLLLNSVVLRQNPHNVFEWHKRIKLFKGDAKKTLMTFVEAVQTVDPQLANGKLSGLWLSFAKHYEKCGDLDSAREVLLKATKVNFKTVDELAMVWCGWGEMELRHEFFDRALRAMQQAVAEPSAAQRKKKAMLDAKAQGDGEGPTEGLQASDRIHRHVKVWSLYLDLEEAVGTLETCRAAYDRALDLKVVTGQMVLNYTTYLEENNFFEDSFRVFEQAVALFTFPQVKPIWLTYLDKFIARYKGTKLERLRDLFEQAVADVPASDAAEFYLKFAKAEEAFGLARHAMAIYDRACRLVPDSQRLNMYRLYIKKVELLYGVTKTRPIYERGIVELSDEQSRDLCLEFAEMERKLGEVDRARAVYQHGSQFADPRKVPHYWRMWKEFEEAHGNEDTFRDMLRVQRAVETANSQVNYLAAEMLAGEAIANTPQGDMEAMAQRAERDAAARAQAQALQRQLGGTDPGGDKENALKRKFVAASSTAPVGQGRPADVDEGVAVGKMRAVGNPDEIDIDDIDDIDGGIAQKPVPKAVFGASLAAGV